jgi:hypothetical protein
MLSWWVRKMITEKRIEPARELRWVQLFVVLKKIDAIRRRLKI